VASLPFCGEAVAYPIAAGNAAHHRAEDDGIKDVHARATAALFTSFDASDAEKEACASALKTEMCRTAFSACDVNANDAELEYCAHAHVPSFGAAASVVGVCTRPGGLTAGAEQVVSEQTEPAEMGARVVCGARWNGVACFSLPAECGAARDTPEGTCPADAEAWRGMSSGCFYASKEKETGGKDEGAFAEFVAVPQDAVAPQTRLATPESADACVASGKETAATTVATTATSATTSSDPSTTDVSTAPQRNATTTARETIAIVKEQAADLFGASGAENRTDPRRAFTRSDRETGGALWILCAQALVAGSLVAAAWTCTRGWLGGENGFGGVGVRWGARRAPNGGPAFFRLKPTKADVADAELAEPHAATKGSTLATLPKRGAAKGSPEKQGARRVAEAPF
jgi:hypothetical protein